MHKYEYMGAMENIKGTVQEGSILAWMEVVFVPIFLGGNVINIFLERFI